jgi:hypothetical protein
MPSGRDSQRGASRKGNFILIVPLDPAYPVRGDGALAGQEVLRIESLVFLLNRRLHMSKKLVDYFNKQPRLGCMSTSGKDGKVNVACFGSPYMVDEKTVIMGISKNRTFENLQENPNAVFMIMEPGKTPAEWKGIRVYLTMKRYETSGEKLETIRTQIAQRAGEAAAKRVHAAVTFEVGEVRPVIDFGQGWEKSV